MITIILNDACLLSLDHSINVFFKDINLTCDYSWDQRVTKYMSILRDKCKIYNAKQISIKDRSVKLTRFLHSPSSPDLSPWDFWFCRCATNFPPDKHFDNLDAFRERLTNLFNEITIEELQSVFPTRIRRLIICFHWPAFVIRREH
jgi:hypothetical protein